MNIWFISKYASPPQYAKAPSRLYFLAYEMKKLGEKVLLITSDANHFAHFPETDKIYNSSDYKGVAIRWLKTKKYTRTTSLARVLSWFDFERKLFSMPTRDLPKPDVVVVSSLSIFSIIYGYHLKRKFKTSLVFEIRDIWPLTLTEEGGYSKWHPLVMLVGFIEKFGYKKADLVVGTMPKLNVHVTQILGFEKPFFCSPLGFNPDNYKETTATESNPFEKYAPFGKTIVGYCGSMGITNALETFIETIKIMKENKAVFFLLVGSGDLKASFKSQLEGYNNVLFLERIDQKQVKLFLEICDILYLSTKDSKVWEYGQSMNKVVEYMLASKPIIATYTGYPSMINEAQCGAFVKSNSPEDLKSSILKFSNMTEEARLEVGERGKKWIYKHRTYGQLGKQYLNELQKLR